MAESAQTPRSQGTPAIAVIGIACRLPGAPDPQAFWKLLDSGQDAITEAPADRWNPDTPIAARFGGFLDQVDRFDAGFFGVSPREATVMDPQQRLMLELGWEALEDARIVPADLRGSRTGVFVGAIADDYARLMHAAGVDGITAHTVTGTHRGIIANRVSYVLDLHGPSMTVDTAQSSGLVAVRMACESLARGDSTLALAGGVSLNILAETTLSTERFGGLSPDGRCYTFDERANGYVRGEGGAALLLKPYEQALADGDRIHWLIMGGAVNSDGATDGLTVPSGRAQEEVIRRAYDDAGIDPARVQYVELHGTGTRVGDPTEAAALGAALGTGRAVDAPLLVGSAKTNIGHLEGAAGIVGLLKAGLSIAHRRIPASLNYEQPNPEIPLDDLRLRVRSESGPWPHPDRQLVAGVSSFGMGGTNGHLVLASPPDRVEGAGLPATDRDGHAQPAPSGQPSADEAHVPWLLSGKTETAMRAQAGRLLASLSADAPRRPADVALSLATTRTHFAHRAAVVAGDLDALTAGLESLALGKRSACVVTGRGAEDGALAFLFTGQGSQRLGMGRQLYETHQVFADAFDEVCAELDDRIGRSLRAIIWAEDGEGGTGDAAADRASLDETRYTQPALFAIEVALFRLITSWGVRPDYLAGHSIGEVAAAHVAGVLSLADAATLIAARGRLMQALPTGGAMIALQASEAEVGPLLRGSEHTVGLAAINSPGSTVISGAEQDLLSIAEHFRRMGRKTRQLTVSHAFHSPLMAPMLAEFQAVAETLTYHEPAVPLVSTVTGEPADAGELQSAAYWVRHVAQPVRFAGALNALNAAGVRTFLEVGPGGVLTAMGQECLDEPGTVFLPGMREGAEGHAVMAALAGLHVNGTEVDWRAVIDADATTLDLPTYAFQRRRYWSEHTPRPTTAVTAGPVGLATDGAEDEETAQADAEPARRTSLGTRELTRELTNLVRNTVGTVLGHASGDDVVLTHTFKELGFDSLLAVELRNILNEELDLRLPAALLFNHPTPAVLVDHLVGELSGTSADSGAHPATALRDDEPIAVVAMSCRYPDRITSPEELWQVVAEGIDTIGDFPADRGWDLDALLGTAPSQPGLSSTRHGGFLDTATEFDANFFGINPREAAAMDPQQRLLLEAAWEVFESAGIDPASVRGKRVGTFIGATAMDYGPRLHETADGSEGYLLTGGTTSVASGRLAYSFGLEGPALTVDTACSSSLVALHLAVQSLR
ncbi:type I polyketide synthase, partial [Kitasatospora sp. NPDC058162]|uniref:type I polyketide synthase n=1 Tax=Kitasatospora sp. NPDC058162 TaxID=3346362 RepID=UPI0036DE4E73